MHAPDTVSTEATTTTRRRSRSRKVRAILAGGLVLGIGAAITLAAWTDNEYASGTFSAGTFNLQGSSTSATAGYADHTSATGTVGTPPGPAALTFTAPFSNLSPGQTVYAPFWVRLAANTTSPATIDLVSLDSTDTTGTNSGQLTYAVYQIAATDVCGPGVSTTTNMGGPATTTLADSTSIPGATPALTIGSPTTNPGTALQMCFVVTAGAGLQQGGVTSATWQFTATSN